MTDHVHDNKLSEKGNFKVKRHTLYLSFQRRCPGRLALFRSPGQKVMREPLRLVLLHFHNRARDRVLMSLSQARSLCVRQ